MEEHLTKSQIIQIINQQQLILQKSILHSLGMKKHIRNRRFSPSKINFTVMALFSFTFGIFISTHIKICALDDTIEFKFSNVLSKVQQLFNASNTNLGKLLKYSDFSSQKGIFEMADKIDAITDIVIKNATKTVKSLIPEVNTDDYIDKIIKSLILKYSYEKSHQINWLTEKSLSLMTVSDHILYHLNKPNPLPDEETTIFQLNNFVMINRWIGYACKYKLIFRASRDGFSAKSFHEKCDHKHPTVTIIKNNYGKIIGGYTTQEWETPSLKSIWSSKADIANESFIFSISMKKKFKLVNNIQAIMINKDFGPIFGGGMRLAIGDQCNLPNSCFSDDTRGNYEKASQIEFKGSDSIEFSVIDYEVFLIEN